MKPQCRKQNCVVEARGASHSPIHSAFLPGPSRRYFGTMEEPLGTVEQSLKTVGPHLKGPTLLPFPPLSFLSPLLQSVVQSHAPSLIIPL